MTFTENIIEDIVEDMEMARDNEDDGDDDGVVYEGFGKFALMNINMLWVC